MAIKAHTRRILVALLAVVIAIGLSITSTVAHADDGSIAVADTDTSTSTDVVDTESESDSVEDESESADTTDIASDSEADATEASALDTSADDAVRAAPAAEDAGSAANYIETIKTCEGGSVVVDKTIELSGDIELKEGCSIKRGDNLMGPIFRIVDSSVTITGNGAAIDGNKVSADFPLIVVEGGKLTLNGVTMKNGVNNKTPVVGVFMTDTSWDSKGGAIGARQSTVNLNGVTIENNTATLGGGLYVDGSTVNVNSGAKFEGNQATYADASSFFERNHAAGAGIFVVSVYGDSTVTVNDKASFLGNGSENLSAGGAIATGRLAKAVSNGYQQTEDSYTFNLKNSTTLYIRGGNFKENNAGLAGGAIFVQRSDVAHVTGGTFESNFAQGHAVQNFAGGAIYVEGSGVLHGWEEGGVGRDLPGGKLYLTNARITGNTAGESGGGIGLCDTGDGFVGYTNGAAVYGNEASVGKGQDVHVSRMGSAPSTTTLSRMSLGDVENKWAGKNDAGEEIDPYYIAPGTNDKYRYFDNGLTEEDVKGLESNVDVTFKGNKTKFYGGAIAVNGDLIVGKQIGAFYIKKIDGDTTDVLDGATFTLTGPNDYNEEMVTQNGGEAVFRDLLPGEYKLVETKAPEGYPDLQRTWTVMVGNETSKYAVTIKDDKGKVLTPAGERDDAAGNVYGVYELVNTKTVTKPGEIELHTTATDNADGDKTVAVGKVEVKDVIEYKGLQPGSTYTVKGKLVVKGTDGKDVVAIAQTSFVAESENGEVAVIFSVDTSNLAGKELVAYEYLFLEDVTGEDIDLDKAEEDSRFVAKHADDNDIAQTVSVEKPGKPNLPVTGLPRTGSSMSELTYVVALLIAGGAVLLRGHRRKR